jgi:hypothetical protein
MVSTRANKELSASGCGVLVAPRLPDHGVGDGHGGSTMSLPKHTSLEREFFAAVPPRKAPMHKRAMWWLLFTLAALPPIQALIRKRTSS